jgi:DNA-binding response OmpR family regulator
MPRRLPAGQRSTAGKGSVESAGIAGASAGCRLVAALYGPLAKVGPARSFVTPLYWGLATANLLRQNFRMNARTRLLVVDDDPSVRSLLREYLEGHGYAVAEAGSGAQMREQIERELPDAVLLDVRLPGEDGLVLARYLREHHEVGIIMVTASGDVVDRVVGLELGADDYIAKPFDLRELLARLKSVLRRLQAKPSPESKAEGAVLQHLDQTRRQRFGRCEVDLEARRMFEVDGSEVTITAMEFDLLAAFLANPNRVLSRDQLLMRTRNREWEPFDRSIDIRIGRLRRKVEPDPDGEPRTIRTVRNAGYMFIPSASESASRGVPSAQTQGIRH